MYPHTHNRPHGQPPCLQPHARGGTNRGASSLSECDRHGWERIPSDSETETAILGWGDCTILPTTIPIPDICLPPSKPCLGMVHVTAINIVREPWRAESRPTCQHAGSRCWRFEKWNSRSIKSERRDTKGRNRWCKRNARASIYAFLEA